VRVVLIGFHYSYAVGVKFRFVCLVGRRAILIPSPVIALPTVDERRNIVRLACRLLFGFVGIACDNLGPSQAY